MKTFMNTCVLAVVLGMSMSSGTVMADFDNDAVADLATSIGNTAAAVSNADLRAAGIPRGQRVTFLAGLRSIAQDASQIAELADGPDNQVEDDIEALARRMRDTSNRLADRAEDLDNQEVEDFFKAFADGSDDLIDEVN